MPKAGVAQFTGSVNHEENIRCSTSPRSDRPKLVLIFCAFLRSPTPCTWHSSRIGRSLLSPSQKMGNWLRRQDRSHAKTKWFWSIHSSRGMGIISITAQSYLAGAARSSPNIASTPCLAVDCSRRLRNNSTSSRGISGSPARSDAFGVRVGLIICHDRNLPEPRAAPP